MYTVNDRFNRARKQAEVYRLLATVATEIAKNVDKIAGKIYDRRVVETLNQIASKFDCQVYDKPLSGCSGSFHELEISAFCHRDYRLDDRCTNYIDDYSVYFCEGFDITPGGKQRVNGENLARELKSKAERLCRTAAYYDDFENVYRQMIEDLNEAMTILKGFNAKYDGTYRDLAGVSFSVRPNSSHTNWDVKWA